MLNHILALTHNFRMQFHPLSHIINNLLIHPSTNQPPNLITSTFSHKKLARKTNTILALVNSPLHPFTNTQQ